MAKQITSRTKRRMEKRQAVWMLTLVLVASLVSFGLGIMVGKRGTPPVVEKEKIPQVTRLPIAPEPVAEKEAAAPQPVEETAKPELTFYETLAETKKQPLGSGINLPPQKEKKPEKPVETALEKKPAIEQVPPVPQAPQTVAKVDVPAAKGYVVQTGSFKKMEDAERLKSQLTAKGYKVFIRKADLKEKGVWYRVLLGPIPTKSEADAVVADIKKKERLSGFVRKL
jgi:cell division protein FtsN